MTDRLKNQLDTSMQIQKVMGAIEIRDRNMQEENFIRVNSWSCINLVVILVSTFIQTVIIHKLFQSKNINKSGMRIRT